MATNNNVNDVYLQKTSNLLDVNSASASFNNINPMTTKGDIIYASATATGGTAARLGIGSNGQVLTVASGLPAWGGATGGTGGGSTFNPISSNWYAAGFFAYAVPSAVALQTISTGILYFYPFFVTTSTTYKAIGVGNGASSAGTTVLGIYNDSGSAQPTGNPINNSNSTDITNNSSATSQYTFSSPITLSVGLYWLAFSVSANTDMVTKLNTYSAGGTGLGCVAIRSDGSGYQQLGWSQSFTYNTTLPSVGSLSAISGNGLSSNATNVYLQAN